MSVWELYLIVANVFVWGIIITKLDRMSKGSGGDDDG